MSRRRRHGGHENHERWLVSYADFITLLFALFVVMFASSQSDKGKAQRVADSVRNALEEGQVATMLAGILGGTVDDKGKGNGAMRGPGGTDRPQPVGEDGRGLSNLLPSVEYLTAELKDEIEAGKLQVRLESRGLVVSLMEAAFFRSADDAVLTETYPSIGKIAAVIQKLPNPVRLEGHTDAVPIHNSRFRSNWELSSARAIAMLELLSGRYGLPVSRMAVAGYAENIPLAPNDTQEGRARNRRVDIVVLNKAGYASEPEPSAHAAAKTPAGAGHGSAPAGGTP